MPFDPNVVDVVCMGRSSVDLYGEQIGCRLEDMGTFAKYVGGSPTNTAIGASRLGLNSALITRVGDEQMGRFIVETLADEGVDTSQVVVDKERLSALVILGIRDKETFPLIFYRDNCADMALDIDDLNEKFIGDAKSLLISGTHLSNKRTMAVCRHAMVAAAASGSEIILDIDYRPVLWGLTGHGLGEERFVPDDKVSRQIQSFLGDCTVIVGTEEEFHIAGGSTDTVAALKVVRTISDALLVVKLGAKGCAAFTKEIPDKIAGDCVIPGFPIEVFNVLGAGDAFMAGFLRGFLRDEDVATSCRYANASGALTVSRHGCAPAIPSWTELEHFLENGSRYHRLLDDPELNHIHWASNRKRYPKEILAFAFDHRLQFEDLFSTTASAAEKISEFKSLCLSAVNDCRKKYADRELGLLCDSDYGQDTLDAAIDLNIWVGRPIELPGSRPLSFADNREAASILRNWPLEHCVKCLVRLHPNDSPAMRSEQEKCLKNLYDACRETVHELLLEIVLPDQSDRTAGTFSIALTQIYDAGIYPDWWKLPAPDCEEEWAELGNTIEGRDPHCRGIVLLGMDASEDVVMQSIVHAARNPVCKGFAIGRTIFRDVASAWVAEKIDDDEAIHQMSKRYGRLIECWIDNRKA